MNPFQEQLNLLNQLLKTPEMVKEFVVDNKELIISLNQNDQLYEQGIKANNLPILPKYTAFTKAVKARKGQRIDHVTLKDTGKFYESFEVVAGSDSFEIIAKDSKTEKLKAKYDSEILGLTEENIGILREKFCEYAINKAVHSV